MAIEQSGQLREVYPQPNERAVLKEMRALDVHARRIIALSPFLVMGTADGEGRCDVSPKGDSPGFVHVVDDHTLLVPDRPGNNRLDGLSNMLENPHVGLLFMVPGMDETLRVNGTARIVTDEALLAPMAVQGKLPRSALEVRVEEVFLHCPKAFVRSGLWDPERRIDRASVPTMGQMMADQIGRGLDPEAQDRRLAEAIRNDLY